MGNFRVLHDAVEDDQKVIVVAVGEKSHDVLKIGGEEIEL